MVRLFSNVLIHYSLKDSEYVSEIGDYLDERIGSIFTYFGIASCSIPIHLTDSKKHFDLKFSDRLGYEAPAFVVGCIDDHLYEVHVVSFSDYSNTVHRYDTLEDYKKMILHECVHFVHSMFCNKNYPINCIWEGAAYYFSGQYCEEKIESSIDELLTSGGDGQSCYTVFRRIAEHYDKNTVLKILNGEVSAEPYIREVLGIRIKY